MNPWKPTLATVISIIVTGAAIVWRLAVLETHVEELRIKSESYVTLTMLRYELALSRRETDETASQRSRESSENDLDRF